MSRHSEKRIRFVMTGGISMILLILVVLLLVSFASLSISAARADLRLSRQYQETTDHYYQARNQGQEFLAALDQELQTQYKRAGSAEEADSVAKYQEAVEQYAKANGCVFNAAEGSTSSDVGIGALEKKFPAGEDMELILTVEILFPAPEADSDAKLLLCHVTSEKMHSTVTYDYDTHLNVISQ